MKAAEKLKAEKERLAKEAEEKRQAELMADETKRQAELEKTAALLRECEKHLKADRLTIGYEGTAFDCYQTVLKREPDNQQAKAGLVKIEERYRKLIAKAQKGNQPDKVSNYLERLRKVNPESEIFAEIESLNQEKALEAQIQAETERLAREAEATIQAEKERLAREAEAQRLAQETEEKRKAEEQRLAQEAEAKRKAEQELAKKAIYRCRLTQIKQGVPIALVIANSQYANRTLRQPINDAKAMVNVLTKLGFKVIFKTELNRRAMNQVIGDFSRCLQTTKNVGLFYFTGYGVQVKGKNYLLPIKADIEDETDVEYEAFPVNKILTRLKNAKNDLNIIILDASRYNPALRFSRSGLASIKPQSGFFIAYPTDTDKTVHEEPGARRSLYNRKFIGVLEIAKQNHTRIEDVFMQVANAMYQESNGQQVPQYYGSSKEKFCFGGCNKLVVAFMVRSNVNGAIVFIDGTRYGETPLNIELLKGWHTIRVEKSGYVPIEQSFDLQTEQQFFAGLAKKVKLRVRSNMDAAKVIIKGQKIKWKKHGILRNREINMELPPGKYTIRVEKSGYLPFEQSFDLQTEKQLFAELVKIVTLTVRSNVDGAMVVIKGKYIKGKEDIKVEKYGFLSNKEINMKLPVGKYSVLVKESGYLPSERLINLQKDGQIVDVYLSK